MLPHISADYGGPRQLFVKSETNVVLSAKLLILKHLNPFSMKASLVLMSYEEQLHNAVGRSAVKIGIRIMIILVL